MPCFTGRARRACPGNGDHRDRSVIDRGISYDAARGAGPAQTWPQALDERRARVDEVENELVLGQTSYRFVRLDRAGKDAGRASSVVEAERGFFASCQNTQLPSEPLDEVLTPPVAAGLHRALARRVRALIERGELSHGWADPAQLAWPDLLRAIIACIAAGASDPTAFRFGIATRILRELRYIIAGRARGKDLFGTQLDWMAMNNMSAFLHGLFIQAWFGRIPAAIRDALPQLIDPGTPRGQSLLFRLAQPVHLHPKVRARVVDELDRRGFAAAIPDWRDAIDHVRQSPFLRAGLSTTSGGDGAAQHELLDAMGVCGEKRINIGLKSPRRWRGSRRATVRRDARPRFRPRRVSGARVRLRVPRQRGWSTDACSRG
jgi:hypothetical protein